MTFNDYVGQAMTTSTFKKREKAITCGLFGLAGEVHEYLESPSKDELGDCFWYIALLSKTLEIIPERIDIISHVSLETKDVIDELQEVAKKVYRDYDYDFVSAPDTLSEKFMIRFNQVYSCLMNTAFTIYGSPQAVWERNIEKLFDRMDRGVIKGEGDNR